MCRISAVLCHDIYTVVSPKYLNKVYNEYKIYDAIGNISLLRHLSTNICQKETM